MVDDSFDVVMSKMRFPCRGRSGLTMVVVSDLLRSTDRLHIVGRIFVPAISPCGYEWIYVSEHNCMEELVLACRKQSRFDPAKTELTA